MIDVGGSRAAAPDTPERVAPWWSAGSTWRSLQEIIVAILFVAMVGFGPLAGMLTLSFATIGFLAKLLAEDIEDTDAAQLEVIRATGASWPQLLNYAVQPQVMPRLIGIVGAGGVGLQLQASVNVLAWNQVTMIVIVIFATVLVSEGVSARVRHATI